MDDKERNDYYRNQIDGTFLLKMRHIISYNYYDPYPATKLCTHTGVSKDVVYRLQSGKRTSNVELASVFAICDRLGFSPFDFAKAELKERLLTTFLKKLQENGLIEYNQIEAILSFSNVPTEDRQDFIDDPSSSEASL
jgi:hypothetical protein